MFGWGPATKIYLAAGSVVFEFQMGRGRAGPKRFLEGFEGLLQTDGYVAYEKVGGPKMVHAACWAHARRGVFEAHELAPGETVAKGIVEGIDDLFAIDRVARENGCDFAARHRLRADHAPELLSTIKAKMEAAQQQALPASKLGKAVAYALGLWPRLKIFLQYPEVELSTNQAENSMRGRGDRKEELDPHRGPMAGPRVVARCCPAISRTESTGWRNRVNRSGSRMAGVPVKWAFSRKASRSKSVESGKGSLPGPGACG